jgi:hypothetical protein
MYRWPVRVVMLGGAPGIGKSTVARRLLELAQGGPDLVQWVDVDSLWLHQPWRVDERMTTMMRANLRAVADHSAQAGVDVLLITWVFQSAEMHRLVTTLLPPASRTTSVQLYVLYVWVADPKPRAQAFYRKRGFVPDGTAQAEDGVRAIRMVRDVIAVDQMNMDRLRHAGWAGR